MRQPKRFPPEKRNKKPKCRIRYVDLKPSEVFNSLDPQHQTCSFDFWNSWGDTWWEPETVAKRQFFAHCFKEEHDKITGHFAKLKQSILAEGLKHPILVVSGPYRDVRLSEIVDTPPWFPPDIIETPDKALYVHTHGGSRFMMAEELKMETIPCAVIDFANMFPSCPEIDEGNYKSYFGTGYLWSTRINVRIINRSHYHLVDDPKYKAMNGATREAQNIARNLAALRTRKRYDISTHAS